jgi:hypothetical protein
VARVAAAVSATPAAVRNTRNLVAVIAIASPVNASPVYCEMYRAGHMRFPEGTGETCIGTRSQ